MKPEGLVFALEASEGAARDLIAQQGGELGTIEWEHFDDGEGQILVQDPDQIRKREVTLVADLNEERHFLELMSLVYGMRHQFRASAVNVHIPHLGYEPITGFGGKGQEVNQAAAFLQALKLTGPENVYHNGPNVSSLRDFFPHTTAQPSSQKTKLVLALEHTKKLAEELCDLSDQHELVGLQQDEVGRMFLEDPSQMANRDVMLMASLETDAHFMQTMALIEACRSQFGASSVEGVIPYLGYSTMERMAKVPGEIARGIPHVQGLYGMKPERLSFLDLHVENYLNCGGPEGVGEHMMSQEMVVGIVNEIQKEKGNVSVISPDLGRSSWVRKIGGDCGLPYGTLDKKRSTEVRDKTEVSGGDSDVIFGRTCIIFDDMVRTFGSAAKAAERLYELGAKEVIMISTHLVLPKSDRVDAEKRVHDSRLTRLIGTNSHSRTQNLWSDKIEIRSIAPLILEHVRRD